MKFIIYRVSDGWDINKQPHNFATITKVEITHSCFCDIYSGIDQDYYQKGELYPFWTVDVESFQELLNLHNTIVISTDFPNYWGHLDLTSFAGIIAIKDAYME